MLRFLGLALACVTLNMPILTPRAYAGDQDSPTPGRFLHLEYRSPGAPLRLTGAPIRESVIRAAFSAPAMLEPVKSPAAGISVAQASPAFPGNRGCGLLQVDIPLIDTRLIGLDRDATRNEVIRMRSSEAYAQLEEAVRAALDAEWWRLEVAFGELTSLAAELTNGIDSAMRRVDQLDVQACNLADQYGRVQPFLARWKATCQGVVSDETSRWCFAERQRLQPEAEALGNADQAMKDAATDFENLYSRPLKDKNAAAVTAYEKFKQALREHEERVQEALKDKNPKCRNRVNIHIQRNGFPQHQPYEDGISSAINASLSDATSYLNLVSDAFYLRNAGTSDVIGLGLATDAARLWLNEVSTPPPPRHLPFNFAPGPPTNRASNFRFDITITGKFPCPERPMAWAAH